jgi:hypothetical protein
MILGALMAPAKASITYDLFLNNPSGISGTETLSLSQAVDPTNRSENLTGLVTGLTFNIDGETFTLGTSGFTLSTVVFDSGVFNDITVSASLPGGRAGTISLFTTSTFSYDNPVDDHLSSGTVTAELASPVPEASTWAMMILGFLGVGFMAYRKKWAMRSRLIFLTQTGD